MGFQLGGWNNLASTSNLSWKICDPVADQAYMLKYKTVQELIDIGTENDVGLSRLIRLAYPAVAITWAEVKFKMEAINGAWTPGADLATVVAALPVPPATFTRAAEVHTTISDIITSGQATILDTPGHGDNFHVIKGREAWSVTRNELGNMIYLSGHFSMEFDVTCLMGCATTRLEALDLETQRADAAHSGCWRPVGSRLAGRADSLNQQCCRTDCCACLLSSSSSCSSFPRW